MTMFEKKIFGQLILKVSITLGVILLDLLCSMMWLLLSEVGKLISKIEKKVAMLTNAQRSFKRNKSYK